MALAPYWLMPTLWPFPVPVMVMPPREAEPRPPELPPVRSAVPGGGDGGVVLPLQAADGAAAGDDGRTVQSRQGAGGAVHRVAAAAPGAAGDGEPQAGDVLAQGGAVKGHPGIVPRADQGLSPLSTKVTEYTLPRSVTSDT